MAVKYLSLDLGTTTIGMATSSGFLAQPYKTIRFKSEDYIDGIKQLVEVIKEIKPETIVVGYPKNMDGSSGHRVEMVEHMLDLLKQQDVFDFNNLQKVDERLTTRMAKQMMIDSNMNRKKRKQSKDDMAAVLILDTFLNSIK